MKTASTAPQCSVSGCDNPAHYSVYLESWHPRTGDFRQRDGSCPFICEAHCSENESEAEELPSGIWAYPYTKHGRTGLGESISGVSTYEPLKS
jgi:hypothetical protein